MELTQDSGRSNIIKFANITLEKEEVLKFKKNLVQIEVR